MFEIGRALGWAFMPVVTNFEQHLEFGEIWSSNNLRKWQMFYIFNQQIILRGGPHSGGPLQNVVEILRGSGRTCLITK